MRTDRVFVDTNILLSGLVFKGNESKVLDLAIEGTIRLVVPEVVIGEARTVLGEKFPRHTHVLDEFLSLVGYDPGSSPSEDDFLRARAALRDPGDVPVLAAVLACKPDFALTGDNDLLTPEVRAVFLLMTAREFLSSCRRNLGI